MESFLSAPLCFFLGQFSPSKDARKKSYRPVKPFVDFPVTLSAIPSDDATFIQHNFVIFHPISNRFIPFDSSLNALFKIFWVRSDPTDRWPANGRQSRRAPQLPAGLAAKRFRRSSRNQKSNCRPLLGLSIATTTNSIRVHRQMFRAPASNQ